jgi:hypothetical protein
MHRLRRVRIAYVLAALGALAAAGALVVALGMGGNSGDESTVPPEHIDIGGGNGPRSCVVRSLRLTQARFITVRRSAVVNQPVRATVTVVKPDGSRSTASATTTLRETATATGSALVKVKVTGRAGVCARAVRPRDAQRRADAAALGRARERAQALAGPALRRAESQALPGLERRTQAQARAAAERELRAALPRARAEAERRAARAGGA